MSNQTWLEEFSPTTPSLTWAEVTDIAIPSRRHALHPLKNKGVSPNPPKLSKLTDRNVASIEQYKMPAAFHPHNTINPNIRFLDSPA